MRTGQAGSIVVLALGLLAWSFPGGAEQPAGVARIGILSDTVLFSNFEPILAQVWRDLGWVEGHNLVIERRYAREQEYEVLPSLAAELVSLQPDLILAIGTPAARAAKDATQTIPIVFARSQDPVGSGLVPSLARPGGNVTGVSIQTVEINGKRLQLLSMAVPDAKRVGALWDPSDPLAVPSFTEIEGAARSLNLELVPAGVSGTDDVEPAIRAMVEQRAGALILVPPILNNEHYNELVDFVVKARFPAMFLSREDVARLEGQVAVGYAERGPCAPIRAGEGHPFPVIA